MRVSKADLLWSPSGHSQLNPLLHDLFASLLQFKLLRTVHCGWGLYALSWGHNTHLRSEGRKTIICLLQFVVNSNFLKKLGCLHQWTHPMHNMNAHTYTHTHIIESESLHYEHRLVRLIHCIPLHQDNETNTQTKSLTIKAYKKRLDMNCTVTCLHLQHRWWVSADSLKSYEY